jgi:hypothetical protein
MCCIMCRKTLVDENSLVTTVGVARHMPTSSSILPVVVLGDQQLQMVYPHAAQHTQLEKEMIGKLWQLIPGLVKLMRPLIATLENHRT